MSSHRSTGRVARQEERSSSGGEARCREGPAADTAGDESRNTNADLIHRESSPLSVMTDRRQSHQHPQSIQAQLSQSAEMSAVIQLANGIANEVVNPLSIVQQGLSYIRQSDSVGPEQLDETLAMLEHAVVRVDRIIRGLLTFARRAPLRLAAADLNAVVQAAIALVEEQIHLHGVAVKQELASDLPALTIDQNQMEQVLINVITNAYHAMPTGGTLTLRTAVEPFQGTVGATSERVPGAMDSDQSVVVCEVKDTGVGIAPELVGRVFDPFFTTKPQGNGAGLGLSIAQAIVGAHHGVISLASDVGLGTTVSIVLPLSQSEGG
jgi:signal transduction histidine kinase